MPTNILFGSNDETNVPKLPSGKILFDTFKGFDKNFPALIDLKSGTQLTFGQILEQSVSLAKHLQNLGIEKDDILALSSENNEKYFLPILAGLYIQTPVHLFNPAYTPYELKHLLLQSLPKVMFVSKKSLENINIVKSQIPSLKFIILLDDCCYQEESNNQDLIYFKNLIQNSKGEINEYPFEENFDIKNQVALIYNSSGTTGIPKGVMITHEGFRIDFVHCNFQWIYEREYRETVILVVPFFHLYGLSILKSALYLGNTIFIMDDFDPKIYLKTIETHKINKLFVVPSLVNFLSNSPLVDQYNLSSVNEIFSAASAPTEKAYKKVIEKFNLKIIRQVYGLTELSSGVCITPNTYFPKGSCGILCPNRQLKVIDTNTGEKLQANQPGELCIKGGLMKGYINNEKKTQECIDSEGFLHTGDVGYFDEEGFVYIVDRLKDLIKYKGFQVPPLELEDLLMKHPDIRDAGVVGKPDERCGELPLAFIVKKSDSSISEEEIINYVAEHMSIQKRLHGGVRFVQDLPRNRLGKILKQKLRDLL